MMLQKQDLFLELKKTISRQKKIAEEMISVMSPLEENKILLSQAILLKKQMTIENAKIPPLLETLNLLKSLGKGKTGLMEIEEDMELGGRKENPLIKLEKERKMTRQFNISRIERSVVKRIEIRNSEVAKTKQKKGPNVYAGIASKIFSESARPLVESKSFEGMVSDLLKTNIGLIPSSYISVMLFSTMIAFGVSLLVFMFLLFFSISPSAPFLIPVTNIMARFVSLFWILFVIPILTFLFFFVYPSMERKSMEVAIDQELPFATISMSAIAGSKIEPTNIFNIIISTGEYSYLKNQFIKVMNEINIYGHDLVTALRDSSDNCPSKKLADLYNSLATNITSGGDLGEFFEKRSETLLLDYRLERERYTRASETFIDVYISIVIAAPMILMLLLMMIQVSGLGISLPPTTISLVMILGVAGINFVFLMFLRLKQPAK